MHVPMGPRRREWERLKRADDRLRLKIRQFNDTLASVKENNPRCADLPVRPIDPAALPPMPPMPEWSE